MQYTDTIDESRQYLRLSLELISKHGLPTDPLNTATLRAIWYQKIDDPTHRDNRDRCC